VESVTGADRAQTKEHGMKVMVLGRATAQSEAGELGNPEDFAAMEVYNQQLIDAGVLLAADGLQPTSKGKRVAFEADGTATVIDGPFAESKELIAGYAIWEVASMEEAVEWVRRSPVRQGVVELRKILDADDFAGSFPAELAAAEQQLRAELDAQ
jgi:hypothetical protein